MDSWRDIILKEFPPGIARLSLAADPDGLLLEENILMELGKRGFELMTFEDPVAFRYVYESRYRSQWDEGKETSTSVILRIQSDDLNTVPYDLLQAGRQVAISLGTIFPNLSYPVVKTLDTSDLDALYEAYKNYKPKQMGENATKDFILQHVFEIVPELIKKTPDLLRVLLRRHYRNQRIPEPIDERFIQLLRQNKEFTNWALEDIIPNREAFFAFLQERWPDFVKSKIPDETIVHDVNSNSSYQYSGPNNLPFDHEDVRIYIDNLFIEGLLKPITISSTKGLFKKWIKIGIISSELENKEARLSKLFDSIENEIPVLECRYTNWLKFAYKWAELLALYWNTNHTVQKKYQPSLDRLKSQVDSLFIKWVMERYGGLINLPAFPPVMLHHIPRFLIYKITLKKISKVALLVIDGLSLDQWIVVRENLEREDSQFSYKEETVFAWIPTITPVSRQALFAGKSPLYFPSSIYTTNREETLWLQFWLDQGLNKYEIAYARGLGDNPLKRIIEITDNPKLRILGLVIDIVDRIMHGMQLGSGGMHNQIKQWVNKGFLHKLLNVLLDQGFSVFITSDHGNIESLGIGQPLEGSIADIRGERVRIFSDSVLRSQVKKSFPETLEWPPIGLPKKYFPLIAPDRKAFAKKGTKRITHGGITLEELVVPFVQIERKKHEYSKNKSNWH